ncbi:MAG: 3-oxoacyl-ACP reductase [Microbacteriaceae bacterium]|nr:3-oxoacyl-ACP reductase [Microbacteriaceae bacterium]
MTSNADAVSIITGGARGIGAAISRRFVAEGRPVAIIDLDEAAGIALSEELNAAGGRTIFVKADISDEASVNAAVERVNAELGAPLVLVNNAGITRDNLLFKMSVEDWDIIMSVHLKGAFLMTKAVQSYMVKAKWGRIVGLSSTSSLGNRGQTNYSAAKAGVTGFIKALAQELGQFGVTANAIAPGFIQTDMTARTAERMGLTFEEFIAQGAAKIPVRRVGQVEDVAALANFLVSEESGFVSGQVIYLAGGPKV